jgi:hypothetical protein
METAIPVDSAGAPMRKNTIIIWGATGRARVLRDICGLLGIEVVAVFDQREIAPPPFPDIPFFVGEAGFTKWLAERLCDFPLAKPGFIPAIGFESGRARVELSRWLEAQGLEPVTLIHPKAVVSSAARIGRGVQISIGSVVDINVAIADYCRSRGEPRLRSRNRRAHGPRSGPGRGSCRR